jgi:hypothetical protein
MMERPSDKKKIDRPSSDLDGQYRKIGISALAAALPYRSESKNPAYAPVMARTSKEKEDVAA